LKLEPCGSDGPVPGVGALGPVSLSWQSVQETMLVNVQGALRLGADVALAAASIGWYETAVESNCSRLFHWGA
jgi:hypothetical protein